MEIDIFDQQDYYDIGDSNNDEIKEIDDTYDRQDNAHSDHDDDNNEDSINNEGSNYDSLRQRMSGLAANKAGLQGIDKEKVSQIIYEASKVLLLFFFFLVSYSKRYIKRSRYIYM